MKATAFGLATAVFPLFVMYPSMGYGCCGRASGDPGACDRSCCSGISRSAPGSDVHCYQTHGMKRRGTCRRYSE